MTQGRSLSRRAAGQLPFWGIHLASLVMVIVYGFSWKGFAIAIAGYYFRMFFVTGAYHRYFSHRTYKTSRWFQFVLAFFCETTFQKGVLWWAAHHRVHHKLSDKPGDLHSMKLDGFYSSHVGWILNPDNDHTDLEKVKDLAKYKELVWLNTYWYVPALLWAVASYVIGGKFGLLWGTGVSTVLLWHGTFTINSHDARGSARSPLQVTTRQQPKISLLLALITMGEGWHNNHHYYQRSPRSRASSGGRSISRTTSFAFCRPWVSFGTSTRPPRTSVTAIASTARARSACRSRRSRAIRRSHSPSKPTPSKSDPNVRCSPQPCRGARRSASCGACTPTRLSLPSGNREARREYLEFVCARACS